MKHRRLAGLIVFLALLATADERSFGVIPDGKEMLSAAAAVAHHLEIGVSRDFANAVERRGGDAVSRYGMGTSLLEAVPMTASRLLLAARSSATTTPLFALLPILLLSLAAWALQVAAEALGAPRLPAVLAGVALVLATPLWGYGASDLSEPLQIACLSLALAGAVKLRSGSPERGWELAAGAGAGLAILTKSLLAVAVLPLVLIAARAAAAPARGEIEAPPAPVAETRSKKRKRAAPARSARESVAPVARWRLGVVVSFAALGMLWAAFELVRFGKLFGGYGDETFNYPAFTGLLRLTVFPNKGLLFYAPLVLLAPLGVRTLWRRDPALTLALVLPVGVVFAAAASWWAWDGQAAWGPRLVLPALPMLVLFAGLGAWPGGAALRAAALALALAGGAVNLLGALVPFPQVYALASAVPPQPITAARARGTPYEIRTRSDGVLVATAPHHLSLTPAWSPIRVHWALLREKWRGGEVAQRVSTDGLSGLPDVRPVLPEAFAPALEAALSPFRWPFLGRSAVSPLPGTVDPYRVALRDQTIRAIERKDLARASRHAAVLVAAGRAADPQDLALAAEAAVRAGRAEEADRLLDLDQGSCHPWILFVRVERGRDIDCVPESLRAGFTAGVRAALEANAPVTVWARVAMRR